MTDLRRDASPVGDDAERLRELFSALADGDATALDGLYAACADELYGIALWRTASAADAADVLQEVFVRLAAARAGLDSVADPRAYLRRMAHRAAVDEHRRRKKRRETAISECRLVESGEPSPERRAEARRVSELLGRLPAAQREAVYLRHFAGCSFAEIGRATGVPTFTAASRFRNGMRRLRQLVGVES